ncbi:MAG: enoyl-CoA hydratase-related protein [Sulfuritalea sp.]|nr:enoyl-CoA hydratase-related protein [Sulfuritalea sp.]
MTATLKFQDATAVITLNRPEALNALNAEMIRTLGILIDEVGRSNARVLIIVGSGTKSFCAGADVKGILGKDPGRQLEFARIGQQTFARLDDLNIPSIAVISGFAFGGGLELAMSCSFRVATSSARMGLPEIKLGLIPGYGGTQRLTRLVGAAKALELVTTGRNITAEEAERIGLVNRIEDGEDLVAIGLGFAENLGNPAPAAFKMARDAVLKGIGLSLQEGFELEARMFAAATQTQDATEGVTAFLEKRRAAFAGV